MQKFQCMSHMYTDSSKHARKAYGHSNVVQEGTQEQSMQAMKVYKGSMHAKKVHTIFNAYQEGINENSMHARKVYTHFNACQEDDHYIHTIISRHLQDQQSACRSTKTLFQYIHICVCIAKNATFDYIFLSIMSLCNSNFYILPPPRCF